MLQLLLSLLLLSLHTCLFAHRRRKGESCCYAELLRPLTGNRQRLVSASPEGDDDRGSLAAEEGAPEAVAVRLLSFSRSRAESAPAFPKLVAFGAPEQTSVPRPQAVVDAPPP